MTPAPRTPSLRFAVPWATRVRWAFLVVGVLAFVLGFAGFLPRPWSLDDAHKALLRTLQLFFIGGSFEEIDKSLLTRIASVLAPAATLGATVIALGARIRRRWKHFRLWRKPADELFIGGGGLAAAILAQRAQPSPGSSERVATLDKADNAPAERAQPKPGSHERVATLDKVDNAPAERVLEAAGSALTGYALSGDGLSADDLVNINAARARKVWVLTGDDRRNLEIVRKLLRMRAAIESEQQVLVCMRDPRLARATRNLRPVPASSTRVDYFNVGRTAARQLLTEHPPPYPARDSAGILHLAVVGEGDVVAAVLVHAAAHCIYAEDPARCVRLTLIGPQAHAELRDVYRRHPVLEPGALVDERLARLLPLAKIAALDADPAALTPVQWAGLQTEHRFDAVYVCAKDDLSTFAAARRLLALQDQQAARGNPAAKITICLNDHAEPLQDEEGRWPANVATFDIYARCFGPEQAYPGAAADNLARQVNTAYQGRAWNDLPEAFRWSSRMTADHMAVKQTLLGVAPKAADAAQTIGRHLESEATMQWLMRLEHRRFVVERLVEGWLLLDTPAAALTDAPSGLRYSGADDEWTQKGFLDLNTTLVPFDALTQRDAEKDRAIIRACLPPPAPNP